MYGRSGAPGILHYLLQCSVKLPESVEQQMSSAIPSGIVDAQTVEPSSTDVSKYFADEVEDYEKVIGAKSQGLIFASTLWDRGRETLCADFPAVTFIINRLRTRAAQSFRVGMLEMACS